ncbi:putative Vacuolar proton pyrophosphatase 1 [Trypanosoma cruzi]|uniref:H(+)-exporting diphosphatase n=2 Tax=Trypanosoma cruzi TaxID=5693 RepID=Q4DKH4_TRYCC|nr:vacuolar-type proton translocating pyrophosphatase 1, putative [Trypanosoma cruzi]EAN93017.1 vacuolar-type proton translocating pyrophosphatase 1, putative [Trypanosoma cruzi]PWV04915.1 putative Vacuolar proton pyrophosphatase 1 [Trypanosoma cruzi]RNC41511.1 pyrophosphate-energized vacuolar membrane proton pump [Trypanosoma cruzi]|eukprot:XP_814868.1 vacuolar-type proton translocating pyrophosphatase 1 [Trypanosoma cruzi strain CL Brener]
MGDMKRFIVAVAAVCLLAATVSAAPAGGEGGKLLLKNDIGAHRLSQKEGDANNPLAKGGSNTKERTPPLMSADVTTVIIVTSAALGFSFAMYWWYVVSDIRITPGKDQGMRNAYLTDEVMRNVYVISRRVSEGANAFLYAEYRYMGLFMIAFGTLIFFLLGVAYSSPQEGSRPVASPWANAALSLLAFFVGSLTSVFAGWIGMRIAVYTNARTAVMATEGSEEGDQSLGFAKAFQTAFRGGITMGFALTSAGLFSLFVTVKVIGAYFDDVPENVLNVYECVAAFGLGGSAVACFGRVGGGIYTKAADVGADLVGKVERNIPEDDARNPGVIADCIGDNVGDIAGMGSDLFGSFGEASCAALVIAAGSAELSSEFTYMMYPLLITAVGILVCIGSALIVANNSGVQRAEDVEPTLKRQLLFSTVAATVALVFLTDFGLPDTFTVGTTATTKWRALVCVMCGLWSGLIIGYTTEYYTSNAYHPVQEIAEACETGAATNIIYGLSLGYFSVVPPILAMAVTIFASYRMADLYGFALAALGILSTMSIALTIDAYGPISDNAGGIAEMAHMGHEIREITDALDAAGNTTAAIGKGFAIASAAFVALALYAAYVSRVGIPTINILDARVMSGLLVGAMLPYCFSAFTMKSVGLAAMDMVNEIRRQFQNPAIAEGTEEPDYESCVAIATQAALQQMVAPACLVMLTPIVIGVLFGRYTLAGLLPGAIVSGVQVAISASNTGGAWDNAKKYIEKGGLRDKNKGKGSPQHAAAVIGDTVGDPLKDTSGPALNILIKLMAIISVVFAPVFESQLGGIIMRYIE